MVVNGARSHLPYGITVLSATRHKWLNHSQTDLPTPEGWKAELT